MTLLRSVGTGAASNDRYRVLRNEAVACRVSTATSWPRPVRTFHRSETARPTAASAAALGLADAERRGQYRIGVVGDLDVSRTLRIPARDRQDGAQELVGHGGHAPFADQDWDVPLAESA